MTLLSIDQDKGAQLSLTENCLQADQERAERQRQYLAQLAEETEYESSEATSLATSTMEGEHLINQEEREEREDDSASTTPQECLSADLTPTATPTHHGVDRIRDLASASGEAEAEDGDDVQFLKLQLKEVSR